MKYTLIITMLILACCTGSEASCQSKKGAAAPSLTREKCSDERKAMLAEIIDGTPKKLSDGGQVYWSFNCDSSWLTLKNKEGIRHILFSLDKDLLELTGRLGHVFFYEFDRTILFVNKVVSGCCDPVDYYLYDKKDGTLLNYLGRAVFVSEDPALPYFVAMNNSSYEETQDETQAKALYVFNLNTLTRKEIALPKKVAEHLVNSSMYLENMIKSELINKHILRVAIPYTVNNTEEATYTQKIDLSRYK